MARDQFSFSNTVIGEIEGFRSGTIYDKLITNGEEMVRVLLIY